MKIVLASQSPRRKELLSYIIKEYEVFPSNIDETIAPGTSPEDAVRNLSFQKASAVANKFKDSLVIGSDTVVVYGDRIVGKAESAEEAIKTLTMLSGKDHYVFTGVTILNTSDNSFLQEVVKTKVTFRDIPEKMLEAYIQSGEYIDKAGSYAIQGRGALFVDSISGDYFTIMGFPINTIYKMLDSLGQIS